MLARDRIRELLKDHPEIEVIGEARSGQEAIDSVANQNPDLVFLDVQMPDLDGFDVHAVDYLTKPFDRQRFAEAVDQAKVFMKAAKEPDTARILNMLQELKA